MALFAYLLLNSVYEVAPLVIKLISVSSGTPSAIELANETGAGISVGVGHMTLQSSRNELSSTILHCSSLDSITTSTYNPLPLPISSPGLHISSIELQV